jgi:hypothetical protein
MIPLPGIGIRKAVMVNDLSLHPSALDKPETLISEKRSSSE